MKIFIAPHNDDEILFGLDILIEQKPLVLIVTHSTLQGDNGYERALESYKAIKDLGLSICYLQIDEDKLTKETLIDKLRHFHTNDIVYTPALSDNSHHNLITEVVDELFRNTYHYPNYINNTIYKETKYPELREKLLKHYQTQINREETKQYFI